jgi:hypothetical protein
MGLLGCDLLGLIDAPIVIAEVVPFDNRLRHWLIDGCLSDSSGRGLGNHLNHWGWLRSSTIDKANQSIIQQFRITEGASSFTKNLAGFRD